MGCAMNTGGAYDWVTTGTYAAFGRSYTLITGIGGGATGGVKTAIGGGACAGYCTNTTVTPSLEVAVPVLGSYV